MAKKKNFIVRAYRKLVETRWFYTFTASCTATIVGISLTIGINSCREQRRVRQDARESIMQAVSNLHSRSGAIDDYLKQLSLQDSTFHVAYDLYNDGKEIPDSTAGAFTDALWSYNLHFADKSFEKIFLESYQLWQELDQDDLTSCINGAFYLTDLLEDYYTKHYNQIREEVKHSGISSVDENSKTVTETLLKNKEFCFYMTSRSGDTRLMKMINEGRYQVLEYIDSICEAAGYVEAEKADTTGMLIEKHETTKVVH
jgi:hypothetical protein